MSSKGTLLENVRWKSQGDSNHTYGQIFKESSAEVELIFRKIREHKKTLKVTVRRSLRSGDNLYHICQCKDLNIKIHETSFQANKWFMILCYKWKMSHETVLRARHDSWDLPSEQTMTHETWFRATSNSWDFDLLFAPITYDSGYFAPDKIWVMLRRSKRNMIQETLFQVRYDPRYLFFPSRACLFRLRAKQHMIHETSLSSKYDRSFKTP